MHAMATKQKELLEEAAFVSVRPLASATTSRIDG